MYGYISGNILALDGITATIQAEGTGIGFDVLLSPLSLAIHRNNKNISVWIHHHITDVGQTLFGFESMRERSIFRQLLKVNGIGGKTALSLLGLGEEKLLMAIQLEDDMLLSTVPGIGKKTAQKIIVDLKGSIDFEQKTTYQGYDAIKNESNTLLISSLVTMGYEKSLVEKSIGDIDETLTLEQRTILAIKKLASFSGGTSKSL